MEIKHWLGLVSTALLAVVWMAWGKRIRAHWSMYLLAVLWGIVLAISVKSCIH